MPKNLSGDIEEEIYEYYTMFLDEILKNNPYPLNGTQHEKKTWIKISFAKYEDLEDKGEILDKLITKTECHYKK